LILKHGTFKVGNNSNFDTYVTLFLDEVNANLTKESHFKSSFFVTKLGTQLNRF